MHQAFLDCKENYVGLEQELAVYGPRTKSASDLFSK